MSLVLETSEAMELLHETWVEYNSARLAFDRACRKLDCDQRLVEQHFIEKYGEDVVCGY